MRRTTTKLTHHAAWYMAQVQHSHIHFLQSVSDIRISREGYENYIVMAGVSKTQHFRECKTRLRTRIRYMFRRVIGMSSHKTNKQQV